MGRRLSCILILAILAAGSLLRPAHAEPAPFRVLLHSGSIFLLDSQQKRVPATVGQEITREQYAQIEVTPGSRLYLQRGQNLLRLDVAGIFKLVDLEKGLEPRLSNALRFLSALTKPRHFTRQVKARGREASTAVADSAFFNNIWERIALSEPSASIPVAPEDALSAAAWFHQQGKPNRTAYILERLDTTTHPQNPFYQQLRNDSLRGVPLAGINAEIEDTRQYTRSRLNRFRYQALLIGVNRYDHPAWQTLDSPVADIRSIREMLIDRYRFHPNDIISLENPTFSQVINGFQQLKKTVDPQTRLMIYYAGHGYYPADEDEGYWIPRDGGDPATQQFFIPTSIILSKMKAIKSRQTLLITDSCFSGSLIRKSRGAAVGSGFYRELSSKKSRQIITSGGLEPVSDSGGGVHSVFAGNLLQILSEERSDPLSASELAIELRKSLKNTGVDQTPAYGRLHSADDENGEFFFVQKGQTPLSAKKQVSRKTPAKPEASENSLDIIGMTNPPANDGSAFQAAGVENWRSIGLFVHQGNMEYNYQYTPTTGAAETVRISASLEGIGLKAEIGRTDHKGGYGVSFDLGQFARVKTCAENDTILSEIGIKNCDSQDYEDNADKATLSGLFSHLSLFADYSVLLWREISVQMGGSVQYQYYTLNNFLEQGSLNSSTIGACGKTGVTYRKDRWHTRFFMDFCLTPFELGGSLHELNEAHASDVKLLANLSAGLAAGFQF
jgi:caspase domain-containing protein